MRSARRRSGSCVAAARPSRSTRVLRSVGQRRRARSGTTKVPHTGSRTIVHAAARRTSGCGAARSAPAMTPSTSRQNARATKTMRMTSRTSAQHHAPGFCGAPAGRDARTAGCRARAWPPALPGCPARARRPAATPAARRRDPACRTPCTMPRFSSVLACFGSSLQRVRRTARAPCRAGSCSSSRRRDRC